MGDHVTSAMFLSSSKPEQEHFFTLAQLKAADFSSFEDNVKYTTKVLVSFHHSIVWRNQSYQYESNCTFTQWTYIWMTHLFLTVVLKMSSAGIQIRRFDVQIQAIRVPSILRCRRSRTHANRRRPVPVTPLRAHEHPGGLWIHSFWSKYSSVSRNAKQCPLNPVSQFQVNKPKNGALRVC